MTLGNALYRALGRWVAARLGSLDFVRGVYARRSLAAGEVTAGRSDIDLTISIAAPGGLDEEQDRLRTLAHRIATLRRVLPILGPPEVATAEELVHWYRAPEFPATRERDRGWLRLWGESVERPSGAGTAEEERIRNLPWLFWAWQELPDHFRRRRLRTCCNLLLDMVDVRDLCGGRTPRPRQRSEILAGWSEISTSERIDVERAMGGRRVRDRDASLRWAYATALRVVDSLYELVPSLGGTLSAAEIETRPPFGYGSRTWLLVEPTDHAAVGAALDRVAREPQVRMTTARALAVQMRHRNPWEYFTIADPHGWGTLAQPSRSALVRAIRYYQHRIVPRRIGFAVGTGADRSITLGAQMAQARLWLDDGFVAAGREELVREWRRRYGAWPWRPVATPHAFFDREYAVTCELMEIVGAQLGDESERRP